MTSPRHFSPRLKLLVTSGDDRTDFGEKDDTVTFQRILDTQDMELINAAIMLTHRAIGATARLHTAQLNKGVALLNDAPPAQVHNFTLEIIAAEEEIEQIHLECDALMEVVRLHHEHRVYETYTFVVFRGSIY